MAGDRLKVFENKVPTVIFGSKKSEAPGGWRALRNAAEIHRFYPSPNFVRVIKWRRMRRVRHVARIGEIKRSQAYTVLP
jgi:hypothetical protein